MSSTIYPRVNYEMSKADLASLLNACKPTPVIMVGNHTPPAPQENANRAWAALGEKMGFDHMAVQPVAGKGQRFFSAIPSETAEAQQERLTREAETARQMGIERLEAEIAERQQKLAALTKKSAP
jgi:hypothetical protein